MEQKKILVRLRANVVVVVVAVVVVAVVVVVVVVVLLVLAKKRDKRVFKYFKIRKNTRFCDDN